MSDAEPRETGQSGHGRCLCGAVQLRIVGPMRPVIYCHCTQCRRWTGHFLAATAARRSQVTVDDADGVLCWHESSPGFRRGFCGRCGSPLLWGRDGGGFWSIPAGILVTAVPLSAAMHVHVDTKGDYYTIADGLPPFPDASATTPEIEHWREASRIFK